MDKNSFKKTVRSDKILSPEKLEAYKKRFGSIDTSLEPGHSIYYLFDHNTLTYPYMSEGIEEIMGYTIDELNAMDDPYLTFFMEEDLPTFGNHVFPTFRKYRQQYLDEYQKLTFQIMGRSKRKNGETLNSLLEYQTLEIDAEIKPILSFCKLTEIQIPQSVQGIGVSIYKKEKGSTVQIYHEIFPFGTTALTGRELQVLKLIADGKTGREIAELLFISENTVKNHRQNMMKKLKMKSSQELVRYAVEQGLTK